MAFVAFPLTSSRIPALTWTTTQGVHSLILSPSPDKATLSRDASLCMALAEDDTKAMPPPTLLPDSQDSNRSTSTMSSSSSFPSNAYSQPLTTHEDTPLSSQSQLNQSAQSQGHSPTQVPKLEPLQTRGHSPGNSSEARGSSASSRGSDVSASPTHGAKRTASGMIKEPNGTHVTSPHTGSKHFHSRTMSLDTTTSSVSEVRRNARLWHTHIQLTDFRQLSAQLKSRLSHAMSKVQMDRQGGTLLASPISTTGTTRGFEYGPLSPRTSMANASKHSKSLSQVMNGAEGKTTSWANAAPSRTMPSESYERGTPMRPSLAPSPDLNVPSSSVRRTNGLQHPPKLITSEPSAPQVRRAETPTQQEQDAVDTLLFMSSPANSNRYPRDSTVGSSAAPSPRRSEFARQQRPLRVLPNGMPGISRMTSSSSEEEYVKANGISQEEKERRLAKRRSLGPAPFSSEREVDRILDRMASESRGLSSSPELEGRVSLHSPRHAHYVNGLAGVR